MTLSRKISIVCVAALAVCVTPAWATLTLPMDVPFYGDAPAGTIELSFDDGPDPGTVAITVDNSGLAPTEYIFEICLNLKPGLADIAAMTWAVTGKTGTFDGPLVFTAPDAFPADNSGFYDVVMLFPLTDFILDAFGANEILEITATLPGLTPDSFVAKSTPDGANGPYYGAAKVLGIEILVDGWCGGEPELKPWGCGWLAQEGTDFPEPATLLMLSIGGVGLLRRRRR